MKVEKIDHVHIFVKDALEVSQFFADLFGTDWLGPIDPFTQTPSSFRVLYDNLGIELIQPLTSDSKVAKILESRGNLISAIVLKVTNLDEAISELQAKGVRIIDRGSNQTVKFAFLERRDTKGIAIELVEYKTRLPISLIMQGRMDNLPSPF